MYSTKEQIAITNIIIILVTGIIGSYAGFEINGIQHGGATLTNPGLLGLLDFLWDAGGFLLALTVNAVTNVPLFLTVIFDFIALSTVFVIILIVRGN